MTNRQSCGDPPGNSTLAVVLHGGSDSFLLSCGSCIVLLSCGSCIVQLRPERWRPLSRGAAQPGPTAAVKPIGAAEPGTGWAGRATLRPALQNVGTLAVLNDPDL